MSTWIAAFVAVAAIAATYFFCVRPAKTGHCGGTGRAAQGEETDRELAQLREELRVLRAQDALDSGRVPHTRKTDPSEDS